MTHAEGGSGRDGFPVIGIGASAGGLLALQTFFDNVPADNGMAFVVIVHLDPDRESHLTELLQSRTRMRVREVSRTTRIEPDNVYIIPPDKELAITDGHFQLSPRVRSTRVRTPIDGFFKSLAETHASNAAGIILSGTGSDGSQGVGWIKQRGGVTMAQTPEEADHPGMPRSAVATGQVDIVLAASRLGPEVVNVFRTEQTGPGTRANAGEDDAIVTRILALVTATTGHDFGAYKRATINRRIRRRAHFSRAGNLAGYLAYLGSNPEDVQALQNDLLITVTSFFRDADAFAALERDVLPGLFTNRSTGNTVRAWVTGCATGEEAYSIAILLCEESARQRSPPELQVFATDIHAGAFASAREGLYPESIAADVSAERLEKFFTHERRGYRVKKAVREKIVFATHNLLRDPPFLRLDLVSCRNLLIYLDRPAQRSVFELFHFSLRPGGALFLGTSEGIEHASQTFEVVNKKQRIFRSVGVAGGPVPRARSNGRKKVADVVSDSADGEVDVRKLAPLVSTKAAVPAAAHVRSTRRKPASKRDATIERLEDELNELKAEHRVTREEHETAIEELKASNEEMQSINEEQKATEEELEASKEELQALNEALHSVNQEFRSKNEELSQVNADLANLIDSTDIGTIFLDRQLRLRRFTPAVAQLFNVLPSDIGRPLTDLTHRLVYASLEDDGRHVLRTLEKLEREVPADNDRWFTVRLVPYRSLDDRIEGVVITVVDTTERKRNELGRETFLEIAQSASLAKSNFIGVMSHELRTPLNAILGYAGILGAGTAGPVNAEQAHHLDRITACALHLAHMIDDSLHSVRIEAGISTIDAEEIDLGVLVREVAATIEPMFAEKGLRFEVNGDGGPPVLADATKIKQIVYNLLGNALRYTDSGTVSVSTSVSGEVATIEVADTGIGMAPESIERVFDRFWQADQSRTRLRGGTGLGLMVARSLARVMGGDIAVTSELGKGSRFVVTLPRGDIDGRAVS